MDKHIDFTEQCEQADYSNSTSAKNNIPHTNNTIIFKLLHCLKLKADVKLLEIGSDDMEHLPFLFQKADRISYYGASTSEVLLQKALSSKVLTTREKWSQFIKIEEDGRLEFQDDFFDCCFSANSLYFWKNPLRYFMEIYRVLYPGGKFDLAIVEKKFGGDLPWTQMDFTFYEISQVKDFFNRSGFVNVEVKQMTEEITSRDGKEITRPFVMISGQK
ncbi:SAM-dependent methyltransferase [Pedobacter psychrodurus]|uniref:SAM-dependent methyltransferase n=1 Tax=Pedobacter psychrodurus TaxID=2530456 RepID=A0A4R0PYX2_9SPHI|nr:methyltransferase domain-containing protein [Pedobacter psychrodurus]TCD25529.1 SAM-dependent methyltransferase [Pedobacter psychrodurus]